MQGRLVLRVVLQTAAGFLVALGAVPPSVFAVLRHAATSAACYGPYPFNQLGSSPFWVWASLTTVGTTATC